MLFVWLHIVMVLIAASLILNLISEGSGMELSPAIKKTALVLRWALMATLFILCGKYLEYF